MMAGLLGGMSLSGCRVLDMGCGTGVLAILCAKMGAVEVTAIDNDEWAFTNCLENVERNTVHAVTARLADASMLQEMQPETFDVVLANINLNVLVHDMEHYVRVLKTGGSLLLSGFYQTDHERISEACKQFSLLENRFLIQNDWMALLLRKQ
jgi:ribosomal protein L11 methyltransferase